MSPRRLTTAAYATGVREGDRAVLARALTLIESIRADDQAKAAELLSLLMPHTGQAQRIGISGVPGVGKSMLIEALGIMLLNRGHRVAVLAVDPSSTVTGGSILGDKSRMAELAQRPQAFIRPSPNATTLGGVARTTREAMLVCEAAGYDIVLVETVGVGQSETMVAEMVDTFVVVMLPGAGDELQGIKKGIVELADVITVNKADGERIPAARLAAADYAAALRYLRPRLEGWTPPASTVSALTGEGIEVLWDNVQAHRAALQKAGGLEERRAAQREAWMWQLLDVGLRDALTSDPSVRRRLGELKSSVRAQTMSPRAAATALLDAFRR